LLVSSRQGLPVSTYNFRCKPTLDELLLLRVDANGKFSFSRTDFSDIEEATAEPQPKRQTRFYHEGGPARSKKNLTAKSLARPSRNQNSEYLAQRRKACPEQRRRGRKEIKLPNLAFLASWREQISVLNSHGPPENLRKLRKLLSIAV